jgi:N-acetylglucosamine-6-sulfatase
MTARRPLVALAALALSAAAAAATFASAGAPRAATAAARPNIVFILTDDLSWNLVNARYAPHIAALERSGETFRDYFVADSLCCPSRSTIFTGLYPHDTHVATNVGPDGGFGKFQAEHLDARTYAVALQAAGYRTSMLGKYLNGYGDPQMSAQTAPIPPGWTDWHVANGTGYLEFNYQLNDNGVFHAYGSAPEDYGVDVLDADARSFIQGAGAGPFAVEIATFAPHAPFVPAPRNANDFPGLREPRDPSFNAANSAPPAWLAPRKPIPASKVSVLDEDYRKRAQDVEAVDHLLADVEATLKAEHLDQSTYIVFSSDNGYHIGQHRLTRGKQTAFDTDIRVPLIVAGPGVPHGRTVTQVAQNVDLYPTFAALAGAKPAAGVEGRSLVPLLHPSGRTPAWRTVALAEHHRITQKTGDPDFEEGGKSGNPTTYEAIRIRSPSLPGFHGPVDAVYVEYADAAHEREYYDIANDPYERRNVAARLTAAQRSQLHSMLARYERCHGASACWAAGAPR